MMTGLLYLILIIVTAIAICSIIGVIYLIQQDKRVLGTISMETSDGGAYTWVFKFYDGITYDQIANMDTVRFKIIPKE